VTAKLTTPKPALHFDPWGHGSRYHLDQGGWCLGIARRCPPTQPAVRRGTHLFSTCDTLTTRDASTKSRRCSHSRSRANALDGEPEQTENALTASATPSSYLTRSGSASSPSFTWTSSIYIPFTDTSRDARILSTITEHTENPSSQPTSYNLSAPGSRPVSDAIRRSAVPLYSRGVTGPSTPRLQVVALGI
jgi:hypothetical protein